MTLLKLHWLKVVAIVGIAGVIAGADSVVRQKPAPVVGTPAKTVTPAAAPHGANRRLASAPNALSSVAASATAPTQAVAIAGDVDSQQVLEYFRAGTAQFVDARIESEYAAGHIPGAYSIPFAAFFSGTPEALHQLDPSLPVIVYCGGGDCDASKKVKEMLTQYGFSQVLVHGEGWPGWIRVSDNLTEAVEGAK